MKRILLLVSLFVAHLNCHDPAPPLLSKEDIQLLTWLENAGNIIQELKAGTLTQQRVRQDMINAAGRNDVVYLFAALNNKPAIIAAVRAVLGKQVSPQLLENAKAGLLILKYGLTDALKNEAAIIAALQANLATLQATLATMGKEVPPKTQEEYKRVLHFLKNGLASGDLRIIAKVEALIEKGAAATPQELENAHTKLQFLEDELAERDKGEMRKPIKTN